MTPAPIRAILLLAVSGVVVGCIYAIAVNLDLPERTPKIENTEKLRKRLKRCRIKNKDEIDLYGYAEKCIPIQNKIRKVEGSSY